MAVHRRRLGAFIAESRRALGLSRTRLADGLGISYAYLGHIESGRRPLPDRLEEPLDLVLRLEPGTMHELARAAEVSDSIRESPDLLTTPLERAVAQVSRNLTSEWASLSYDSAQQAFMLTGAHDNESYRVISPFPDESGAASDIADLVESLVDALSPEQLALVIGLLTAARSAHTPA